MEKGTKLKCNNNKPLEGNTVAPPLVIGEEYTALNVITCGCGKEHIDVGLKSEYNYISCYDCGEKFINRDVHYCHPSRFDVVEDKPENV